MHKILLFLAKSLFGAAFLLPVALFGQAIEKHSFNTFNDYYLAVKPQGAPSATMVILTNSPAESLPPETKLHGVAFTNGILTVYCSVSGFVADSATTGRISRLLQSVATTFSVDTAMFVLGGFGFAGNIALRYTEYCCAQPGLFPIKPKAVFTIGSFVDLPELYDWCSRETGKGDLATYTGTIATFDWLSQVPMQLNCRIHLKPGGDSFTPLLIEVSPKPFENPIWQKMEATTEQFECGTGKAL